MNKKILTTISHYLNKYYLYISFILYFILNISILDNAPFADDLYHIFNHSFITDQPNSLSYFNPWSPYFKSWSLTYFTLGNLYSIFGDNFVYYRFTNLLLHFINFFLFRKLLTLKLMGSRSNINLMALLFLFSPLSILTTNWIFQIKTLLSVSFILAFLIVLSKNTFSEKKNIVQLVILFLLSILSKITAVLIPIYVLMYIRGKISNRKKVLLMIPLLIISIFYGLINIKGITYITQENRNIEKPVAEIIIDQVVKVSEYKEFERSEVTPEIELLKEISHGLSHYILPIFNPDTFFDKHIIAMQNLGRLILSTLGLNYYRPFYENNLETARNMWLYLYVLIAILFLFYVVIKRSQLGLLALVLFIPISGYFYIPSSKFSYSSDHWFYPASMAVLLIIFKEIKRKRVIYLFSLPILLNYLFTINNYSNFNELLKGSFKANGNKVLLQLVSQNREKSPAGEGKRLSDLNYLLSEKDFNNTDYYKELLKVSRDSGQNKFIHSHYGRFSADQIKSQNHQSQNSFTLLHTGIYPDRILDLSNALNSIFSHNISNEDYILILKHLD